MSKNTKDLTNCKKGRLTALYPLIDYKPGNGVPWYCKCDCGAYTTVYARSFGKAVNSCGCLQKEYQSRCAPGEAIWGSEYNDYRRNAKLRNLTFELSKEQFIEIAGKNCEYCGAPPKNKDHFKFKGAIQISGIDRKDNKIGYTQENSVPCCSICNYGKKDLEYSDWIKHLDNLAQHRVSLKNDG